MYPRTRPLSALLPTFFLLLSALTVLSGGAAAHAASANHPLGSPTVSYGSVLIWPNGTVSDRFAPISKIGTTYTLTAELNGSIEDQANGTTLDGNGYLVNYTVGEPRGDNAAVSVNGTHGVVVENFKGFENDAYGVRANGTTGLTIERNRVQGARAGIEVGNSTGASLWGNNASLSPHYGIWVYYSSQTNISGNEVNGSLWAIDGDWANQISIVDNRLENDTYVSAYLDYSNGVVYRGNDELHSQDGFWAIYSENVLVEGNLGNFSTDAFGLEYTTNFWVLWNRADHSHYPFWMEYSYNGLVANNTGTWCLDPLYSEYDTNTTFIDNNGAHPVGSTAYGIYSYYDQYVRFLDDNISRSANDGAYTEYDSHVTFAGINASFATGYGIYDYFNTGIVRFLDTTSDCSGGVNSNGAYLDEPGATLYVMQSSFRDCKYGVYNYENYGPVYLLHDSMDLSNYGVYQEYNYAASFVDFNSMNSTGEGVYNYDVYSTTTVDGNWMNSTGYGVYAQDSYGPAVVDGNWINATTYGIYDDTTYGTFAADGNHLTGPDPLSGSSYGIYFYENYGAVEANHNSIDRVYYGIYTYYNYGAVTLDHNVVTHSGDGIGAYETSGGVFEANGNVANGSSYGVWSEDNLDGAIMDGNLAPHSYYGIYAYDDYNFTQIVGNDVSNSTYYGIYSYENYGPVTIAGNDARSSAEYGVYLYGDYGLDAVLGNDLRNAGSTALYQAYSYFGSLLVDNNASGSDYALYSYYNAYLTNQISGNDFSNSRSVVIEYGAYTPGIFGNVLLNVSNTTFVRNTIQNVWGNDFNSSSVYAQYNTLIGNPGGTWNISYPTGGNYWTGYTGVDYRSGPGQNLPGSDGIGDTPYVWKNITDEYPLMRATHGAGVVFTTTGIPSGLPWSVTLGGVSGTGLTGGAISLAQVPGAWSNQSFTVSGIAGWRATPSSGVVWEKGQPLAVVIAFTPNTYAVNFTEAGLPSGTNWSVTIGANTVTSNTPWIVLNEPNGTFTYTLGGVPGYTTAWTGSVNVSAGPTTVGVAFAPVLYTVPFVETGLVAGTPWSVTVGLSTLNASGSSIVARLPNGTAAYTVGAVPGFATQWAGTVVVSPSVGAVSIAFVPFTYTVSFTAQGLSTGTSWSVSINGVAQRGTAVSASFHEVNGTYSYAVGAVPGYTIPASGSLTIAGSNVQVNLLYASVRPLYTVAVTESGLPSGTSWSATLGGTTLTGTGATLLFDEPNATYTLSATATGYMASGAGSVQVNGADQVVAYSFALPTFALTFSETGLPTGTAWFVTVGSQTESSTTATIAFNVPNGTLSYSVGSARAYAPNPASGQATVSGRAASVSISFSTATTTSSALSFSGLEVGLLAGLVVLAVLAALGWLLYMRRRGGSKPATAPADDTKTPEPSFSSSATGGTEPAPTRAEGPGPEGSPSGSTEVSSSPEPPLELPPPPSPPAPPPPLPAAEP